MNFNCFPVELHQVLSFMDPEDILALRKTSKYFLALTHKPHLWTSVYDRMRQTHPDLSYSQSEFAALSSCKSERLLVRASKTEKLFQTFRELAQYRIPNAKTICHFEAFSFLSERFLLSVGRMTGVSVWDMSRLGSSAEAPNIPCVHLPSRSAFNSQELVCYSMTTDYSTLCVVFQDHSKAIILDLELPSTTLDMDETKLEFYQSGHVYMYGNHHHIMGIDADSRLALLTYHDDMIEVVDWHWRTECRSLIRLHQEATEVPYSNPVLALRICGPYIVCLRRQSIDAYPMPLQFLKPELSSERPLPVLQHTMSGMAFTTEVSLSRARHSCFPSGNVYTLYALAEEEHRGSYYFQVQVDTTPLPSLSVRLLGFDSTHASRQVSAWDLGLSGLRGVRVFTPDTSGERHVVAFTVPPSLYPSEPFPVGGGTLDVPPEIAPRFVEQVVAVLSPKHPRVSRVMDVCAPDDDVVACAVSEFTGRIALGTRAGVITVL